MGIVFVQSSDSTVQKQGIWLCVLLAVLGAVAMTIFDVLIQDWAKPWGPGRFLSLAGGAAAVLSAGLLPWADRPSVIWSRRDWWAPLFWGSLAMGVQAIGMTFTLAMFGDATRVNIVYSLRGIWGVLITWLLLKGDGPSHYVMVRRFIGALLIGVSVVISLLAPK